MNETRRLYDTSGTGECRFLVEIRRLSEIVTNKPGMWPKINRLAKCAPPYCGFELSGAELGDIMGKMPKAKKR
jgi:hypothetical protein